ncbi:hypothetical protein I3843_13G078300 [Carya illinoinensis]|uniref:Uncharacterized protein n=1 Tax=Carya illinoinensis TaxID=32201 RepID=A0A8T1NPH3_CARIL|nr:scarecrow-like protein 14 [Carya illinoinensis]KAG6631442.1 hypothetical protein CIPAW_13G091900 [Carya illinoinensis]KAG7949747.1 hypothetical protein I3843_13G078300 [Carya illinoinensis]
MDAILEGFPGSMNGFIFNRGSVPLRLNENLANGFKVSHGFVDPPFLSTDPRHHPSDSGPSSGTSSEGDSPDSGDFSNVFFKYLNEMLMEEDLETKPCMLQNCLALQAAEKSFYEVLVQESPPSSNQSPPGFEQRPDDSFAGGSSVDISNSHAADNSVESKCVCDLGESESSYVQSHRPVSFGEIEPIRTAKGGRTINSLPNGNRETSDLESTRSAPAEQTRDVAAMAEKNRTNTSPNGSREKKNHHREDSQDYLEEGRSSKHSAVYAGDSESLEMYDEVLLCRGVGNESSSCGLPESTGNGGSRRFQHGGNRSSGENNSKTTRLKKQGNKGEVVDLWTLLTQCAHTVASGDQRTANELLKQIRQHSSPFGDGTQRLSHYFANALEVRLAGTRTPVYTPLVSNGTSAADILKAYRVYVTACPFKRMSNFFANRTIRKLVLSQKATRVHIIDFGILYGFQWPCLIQRLSERPGGPPKLRITGIELPQPGFRPAERVEETGRRLENYCKRFNVPFEYSVIAQKWETIQHEDLKIDRDELVIVNCLYRLRNLPDETLAINSPRDTVLKLIKRINPDLFVHGVVNGTYNAPFFATRFREALFHFSAFFDMFDANVAREDEQRFMFEKEIFGRDAMNVIACEGLERVERPEPYKQWQVRNLRAGLRQLPLDQDVLQRVKRAVKSEYHKDFVVDVDGHWMLQGWKGRIIYALSCWRPA